MCRETVDWTWGVILWSRHIYIYTHMCIWIVQTYAPALIKNTQNQLRYLHMYLLKCQDNDRALPILLKRIRYMREIRYMRGYFSLASPPLFSCFLASFSAELLKEKYSMIKGIICYNDLWISVEKTINGFFIPPNLIKTFLPKCMR